MKPGDELVIVHRTCGERRAVGLIEHDAKRGRVTVAWKLAGLYEFRTDTGQGIGPAEMRILSDLARNELGLPPAKPIPVRERRMSEPRAHAPGSAAARTINMFLEPKTEVPR